MFSARFASWKRCGEKGSYFGLICFQMLILKRCHERKQIESSAVKKKKNVNICYKYKFGLTLRRAGAGKSHQSSTKKLICFYGGAESLPPHLHLVALRSGRRGDTPPVGRQDALLKATGGGGTPDRETHGHRVCSFSRRKRMGVRTD